MRPSDAIMTLTVLNQHFSTVSSELSHTSPPVAGAIRALGVSISDIISHQLADEYTRSIFGKNPTDLLYLSVHKRHPGIPESETDHVSVAGIIQKHQSGHARLKNFLEYQHSVLGPSPHWLTGRQQWEHGTIHWTDDYGDITVEWDGCDGKIVIVDRNSARMLHPLHQEDFPVVLSEDLFTRVLEAIAAAQGWSTVTVDRGFLEPLFKPAAKEYDVAESINAVSKKLSSWSGARVKLELIDGSLFAVSSYQNRSTIDAEVTIPGRSHSVHISNLYDVTPFMEMLSADLERACAAWLTKKEVNDGNHLQQS